MDWIRQRKALVSVWLLFLGGYAVVSLLVPHGANKTAFGDVAQCVVLLLANTGLLLNAGSADWRRNGFWMLFALGTGMWFGGQLLWTYIEVVKHQPVPNPFLGDVIFFLHTVPLLAALALRPDESSGRRNLYVGNVDFSLLLCWWVYLYLFIVIPWQYVSSDAALYSASYDRLYAVENLLLVCGLAYLAWRAHGAWRTVYGHLLGAATVYEVSSFVINRAIAHNRYETGSLYDLGLIAAFVWYATAGFVARRVCPPAAATTETDATSEKVYFGSTWTPRLAVAAALSLPVLAIWSSTASDAPGSIRQFRLIVTLGAILVFTSLVFLRQSLVDVERVKLLQNSRESLENLKRIQNHYVQSEKLASLGQLAAGAAHEINNPLTAILGYSEVLLGDSTTPENTRRVAEKIGDQARRTKALVGKLLSFAQPAPAERTLIDINNVITGALELRRLDLMEKKIQIEVDARPNLPGVRGDSNQLLQVFYNIISNAVDALDEVGGGTLIVRLMRDGANVVVEFSDSGPGIKDPQLVFDPFYTTKPAGKGTGLGLSICYGVIKEHKGTITCFNRAAGGATFRIELPAVMALFPDRNSGGSSSGASWRLTTVGDSEAAHK